MFRFLKYLTFCWLLAIAFCGCGKNDSLARNVFRYNDWSGIATLDPAFSRNQNIIWPVYQVYNSLVQLDSSMKLVPALARSWEISADRLRYIFHLRTDILFHDDACFPNGRGRLMKASDVTYSFGRILDPATASPGAWIFNNRVDSLQPFRVIDDSTVEVKLRRPFSPMLYIISMQYCSIVPPEAVKHYGTGFRAHPVGTGPFKFVAWREGRALILERNPHYFERDEKGNQLPYLDGVQVSFNSSRATEFLMFRQGRIDFINDIDPSFKDEVLTKAGRLRKEWEGQVQLQNHPFLNTEYIGILSDSSKPVMAGNPLLDRRVRQAVNYGFDRKKMVVYMRNSLATAATAGFVPVGMPGFDSTKVHGYHYDPVRARQLMQEAGYSATRPARFTFKTIAIYADIASFIARQLEEIGCVVQVEVVQKNLLTQEAAAGGTAFFRASWIADYPDAENYLSVLYSKTSSPPNYTRNHNPVYDALLDRALQEIDDSARLRLYQEADQLIIDDARIVPLWYDQVNRLVQPGITGFRANALNVLDLRRVRKN